jgi:hypothetical protein
MSGTLQEFLPGTVSAVKLTDDRLTIVMDCGVEYAVVDRGQSCCEHRYITTDDDIGSLIGTRVVRIVEKDGPELPCAEVHETRFVEIVTTKGSVTLTTHNEHNGYYGGFVLGVECSKSA